MTAGKERTSFLSKDVYNNKRGLHTDMEVPDFSYYRRSSTKDSSAKNQDTSDR